ncbi:putative calcium-binding protein CML26 [Hibiscus syriacus]|uniref:Calcium-binding protein CML26 n=2 Tax=Hibiscus syriacus TaxID=106335 RepID=A0A6A3C475_HIBSY|nr:putative calcium-binding protein CML26 [Hibiscus syriacus]
MDENLKRVFNQFDKNKDGKISVTELGDVLIALWSSSPEEELKRVMDEIDIDKDGFLNLSEFLILCRSNFDNANAEAELHAAFDLYDQDKNGLISAEELHLVLNELGMTCSVEKCVRMVASADADKDGNINFKEFRKMMKSPAKE